MRKILFNSFNSLGLIMAMGLCLFGCKPESEGELGEPFDKVKGMTGIWELNRFTQQDLNSPVKETRDLSSFYIDGVATPLQLTFNEDRTYAVAIELGKNYFGEGGTWGFDDEVYPTYLELYSATDTLIYNLGGMVREFDQSLYIEYRRDCGGTATNIYTFEFNRLN
ncbi:MAG: DUF5004 domain-containing protein [Bacteroidetes bacterium]|nr:DUF5004 domain-containing protein [Bacteroidota bacterium]MDA1335886.1 DUF5004 domain-containing protein [Bacteroidota bacterium]